MPVRNTCTLAPVDGVVGEVERTVGALERLQLVEQLASLRCLFVGLERDGRDRRVVRPRQVREPRGARVGARDVVGADQVQLGLAGRVRHGLERGAGRLRGARARPARGAAHLAGDLARADLIGEEHRQAMLGLGSLGRPGTADVTPLALRRILGEGGAERGGRIASERREWCAHQHLLTARCLLKPQHCSQDAVHEAGGIGSAERFRGLDGLVDRALGRDRACRPRRARDGASRAARRAGWRVRAARSGRPSSSSRGARCGRRARPRSRPSRARARA